jgi:adenylate cyclase
VSGHKSFATQEDEWRAYLEGTHPYERRAKHSIRYFPSNPRCKVCAAPFGGPGGFLFKRWGFTPWEKNPNICRRCVNALAEFDVSGAEVNATFLFADVRRSSELARSLGTMEFTRLMQRFYATTSQILFDHDGLLDKFVGDEVVGFFLPFMTGEEHAARAIECARALLEAFSHGSSEGPSVPLGAGINTGLTFVGLVQRGDRHEFTALGDPINVAAHLASQAAVGEILVTAASAEAAGIDGERRSLSLKGHAVEAVVVPTAVDRV